MHIFLILCRLFRKSNYRLMLGGGLVKFQLSLSKLQLEQLLHIRDTQNDLIFDDSVTKDSKV